MLWVLCCYQSSDKEAPVSSLGNCDQINITKVKGAHHYPPYLSYPKRSIILCKHSAYCGMPNPRFDTASEKPKLGSDGATTWNDRPLLDSVSDERIFVTSMKLPGPIQTRSLVRLGLSLVLDAVSKKIAHSHGKTKVGCCPGCCFAGGRSEFEDRQTHPRLW